MPEAIATKKRNFYKSLDAFHNPSSNSISTEQPATKRPRRSLSITSIASRHTTGGTIAAKTASSANSPSKPPPAFSPWSHDTFLARLKTFSKVSLWHSKPERINEVEWARRGWTCVDVNTVACKGCCEKRVVVSLDFAKKAGTGEDGQGAEEEDVEEDNEDDMEVALALKYQALIVDGHADTCPWRRTGCPDDIYRLQVIRPAAWQPDLKKRYQSLHQISDSIREAKLKALDPDTSGALSNDELLADLPADVLGPPGEEQPAPEDSLKALEIAMHGWRGAEDSGNELLHCDACFQRIGLWMYQPGYRPSRPSSEDDETDSSMTMDLVELHREHCPWRNAETQKALGNLKGLNACEVLQRSVSSFVREERRRAERSRRPSRPDDEACAQDDASNYDAPASPAPSRDEIEKQDKDRESRLKRLKSLFTVKRKSNHLVSPKEGGAAAGTGFSATRGTAK